MSNILHHAKEEFRAAGWTDAEGKFNDEMQEMMCNHVLKLLEVFDEEGHSGSSAPYAVNMFKKLAMFEPLVPLTGEDWEWHETSRGTFQNRRCSHVFKDEDGRAYDIQGKVFYEWVERPLEPDEKGYPGMHKFKSSYTSRDSRVYVTFPYTPTTEYVDVTGEER
jgi:hypothetical protein